MAQRVNGITTHVLDTALGKPAAGVPVRLERQDPPGRWRQIASASTDDDGRCSQLLPDAGDLAAGLYRLVFETGKYFEGQNIVGLYPAVEIAFSVRPGESHLHIPLLLSPNGYTTYRGS